MSVIPVRGEHENQICKKRCSSTVEQEKKSIIICRSPTGDCGIFLFDTICYISDFISNIRKIKLLLCARLAAGFFYSVGKWQSLILNKEFEALCKVNYFKKYLVKHSQNVQDGSVIPYSRIAEFFCSTENPCIQQFSVYVPIRAPPLISILSAINSKKKSEDYYNEKNQFERLLSFLYNRCDR